MQAIETSRLLLEPLEVHHAERMYLVLSEPSLYSFLDSQPSSSAEELRERYAKREARVSPDGSQVWLNWIVLLPAYGPIGFVQATVVGSTAWIAYLVARPHWSRGYAAEATRAMLDHLASTHKVSLFRATAEAANVRSTGLLRTLGFRLANTEELARLSLSPTECSWIRQAYTNSDGI